MLQLRPWWTKAQDLARMESLLLFCNALSSPTMCRFIQALSVPEASLLIFLDGENLVISNHLYINFTLSSRAGVFCPQGRRGPAQSRPPSVGAWG